MSSGTVLVTGAYGFIGCNLCLRLQELGYEVIAIGRTTGPQELAAGVMRADAIVHLAGANRPADPAEFMAVNQGSIAGLIEAIRASDRIPPVILSSSSRAGEATEYGRSKLAGEEELTAFGAQSGTPIHIFRLPNVFGKWSRPDYNSAIATFCHRAARDMEITIHDRAAPLTLVYIDDVVEAFVSLIRDGATPGRHDVSPCYATTVGEVADTILGFARLRETGMIDRVGTGLTRALYATYVAYLPPDRFSYDITTHRDPRGAFAEMLKTPDAGQFSTFNARPGVTRGGHYHHSKTEKFLVVHGRARFRFRHMISGERHEVETDGDTLRIVETVPGWAHDITNIGDEVMVALLWANEIFDRSRPDTIAAGLDA